MAKQGFRIADSDMHVLSMCLRATEQFLRLLLAETAARGILWDNWARLYGF